MNKKILMICYYYPPLLDVACKRSLAFAKYLKKYGWKPYVISVRNPDKTYCIIGDKRPPKEIPAHYTLSLVNPYKLLGKINGIISRILALLGIELKRNYLYELLCIPDIFFGWIPLTLLKGLNLIKENNIDLIYCSCPPFTAAVVGGFLKMITNKRLIIDFRDPMPSDVYVWNFPASPSRLRKKVDQNIANWFFRLCDLFITTSNELKRIYVERYPQLGDKTFTIYNGFDPSLLINLKGRIDKFKKFTIIYAGNFYLKYGKPETFFRALAFLKQKGGISCRDFQFLYYGMEKNMIDRIAKRYEIEDLIRTENFTDHSKVINNIFRSHLQLLRIAKPMISTKLFEGIGLNIPLLALTDYEEVEEIIRKYSPSSYIIRDDSVEKITDAILDARQKYDQKNIKDNLLDTFAVDFSRESQAVKLVNILDGLL